MPRTRTPQPPPPPPPRAGGQSRRDPVLHRLAKARHDPELRRRQPRGTRLARVAPGETAQPEPDGRRDRKPAEPAPMQQEPCRAEDQKDELRGRKTREA